MNWKQLREGMSRHKRIPIGVYDQNPVEAKSLLELIVWGIGSTTGYGIYFLIGRTANSTGPAILISITVAAISAVLTALCYVEFGSRLPHATSPYFYTYIKINEIMAFSFGWNMILEYAIGLSSCARGLSEFAQYLLNRDYRCQNLFYCFDLYAIPIILLVSLFYTWCVKAYLRINFVVTILNLITIFVLIIAGGFTVRNTSNWSISLTNASLSQPLDDKVGIGGFIPFANDIILLSAAKCFYLFIGFGCITATTPIEHATRTNYKIPIALGVCLGSCYVLYMLVAMWLTLAVPYYEININSPITAAFDKFDMTTIKWIVTVGSILATINAIFGCQNPVIRTVYAMGVDGLISNCLGTINSRTHTPVYATIFCCCISGVAATYLNVCDLIELASLGTLCIRSMSAIFIILIHFRPVQNIIFVNVSCWGIFKQLVIYNDFDYPNVLTANVVFYGVIVYTILATALSIVLSYSYLFQYKIGTPEIITCGVIMYMMIHVMILIARQPRPIDKIEYKVPCNPLVPCISIFLNILLMVHFNAYTWIRFLVWMTIGYIIYFCYGIKQSAELLNERRLTEFGSTQYVDLSTAEKALVSIEEKHIDSPITPHVESVDTVIIDLSGSVSQHDDLQHSVKSNEK